MNSSLPKLSKSPSSIVSGPRWVAAQAHAAVPAEQFEANDLEAKDLKEEQSCQF
jgi:hypothetical protein